MINLIDLDSYETGNVEEYVPVRNKGVDDHNLLHVKSCR